MCTQVTYKLNAHPQNADRLAEGLNKALRWVVDDGVPRYKVNTMRKYWVPKHYKSFTHKTFILNALTGWLRAFIQPSDGSLKRADQGKDRTPSCVSIRTNAAHSSVHMLQTYRLIEDVTIAIRWVVEDGGPRYVPEEREQDGNS